jgi:hypothetical protein
VLAFAERRAKEAKYESELFNSLFSPNGKATVMFPTEAERNAFCRTKEYKQILSLLDTLPDPPVTGSMGPFRLTGINGEQSSHRRR